MELRSAAVDTLVARLRECAAILIYVYATKSAGSANRRELFSFDNAFVRKFFRIALPVVFNESVLGLVRSRKEKWIRNLVG